MNSDIFCASEVEDDHECPYAQCPSLGKSMHIKGCPSQFYVYGAPLPAKNPEGWQKLIIEV